MKKIFAALLTAALVMGLTACGGSGSDSKETKSEAATAVEGEQGTAGKISVFVPKGYVLNQGSITGVDDEDDTQCYMQGETPSMYDYYWIMIQSSEDSAKANAEMTKSSNNAEDASVAAGDTTWTGCTYVYSGSTADYDCGCVYATVDGVVYQVNFCGHALDSAEMQAVLASIKAA